MSSSAAVHVQSLCRTPCQSRSQCRHQSRTAAISGPRARRCSSKHFSCSPSLEQNIRRLSCVGAQATSEAAGASLDNSEGAAAPAAEQGDGQQRINVTLRKPMGMVLAEGKDGQVVVESIVEGGNAAEDGSIKVDDVIRKTSAYVLKEGNSGEYAKRGHGARPFEDYVPIMFKADGEDFKTVMAAIASNNERWGIFNVELELSRPAS